jgi:F-type H+-transporting ATPase subunit epsilon
MSDTLTFDIVTPEGTMFSDQVEMVTLPAIDGQIGVLLPHHVGPMTQIEPGEVTVHKNGSATYFAVGGGLVEVGDERVTIVTDTAVEVARIDEAKIEDARQRAEARLTADPPASPEAADGPR